MGKSIGLTSVPSDRVLKQRQEGVPIVLSGHGVDAHLEVVSRTCTSKIISAS